MDPHPPTSWQQPIEWETEVLCEKQKYWVETRSIVRETEVFSEQHTSGSAKPSPNTMLVWLCFRRNSFLRKLLAAKAFDMAASSVYYTQKIAIK